MTVYKYLCMVVSPSSNPVLRTPSLRSQLFVELGYKLLSFGMKISDVVMYCTPSVQMSRPIRAEALLFLKSSQKSEKERKDYNSISAYERYKIILHSTYTYAHVHDTSCLVCAENRKSNPNFVWCSRGF